MESPFPMTLSGGMIPAARLVDRKPQTVAQCATLATNRDTPEADVHLADSQKSLHMITTKAA
jgi:hypothetical protein